MTSIENTSREGSKKHSQLRIDMTPMVDLGFLLITFFIFTSAMSDSNAMKLYMPKDGAAMPVSDKNVLTVIIDEGLSVHAYEGDWHNAVSANRVQTISYGMNGIGKLILEKKAGMYIKDPMDKLFVIIKPLETADYRNIVNVLDEMVIYDVPSYAIAEATKAESDYVASRSRLNR